MFEPSINKDVYFDMSDLAKFELRKNIFERYIELRKEHSVSLSKRKMQLEMSISHKLLKYDEINNMLMDYEKWRLKRS